MPLVSVLTSNKAREITENNLEELQKINNKFDKFLSTPKLEKLKKEEQII